MRVGLREGKFGRWLVVGHAVARAAAAAANFTTRIRRRAARAAASAAGATRDRDARPSATRPRAESSFGRQDSAGDHLLSREASRHSLDASLKLPQMP